jgi:beta-glucuronidase
MLYPQLNKTRNLLSLDGLWAFAPDPNNIGETENWYDGLPPDCTRDIFVPASWNEQYDDLYNFHGVGWYERKLDLPPGFGTGEERIFLRVGSVFQRARVWVNGQFCGEYNNPHLPFEFEPGSYLQSSREIRIIIRVDAAIAPDDLPPAIYHGAEPKPDAWQADQYPAAAYDFFPYGGIHRPVYLYTTASTFIRDIEVQTEISGRVRYKITLSEAADLTVRINSAGQTTEYKLSNEASASGQFEIANPRLWQPADPFLYNMKVQLWDAAKLLDEYNLVYGVREIKVEGGKLLLNGQSLFLKGFGKHEDFDILGKGLNLGVLVRDFDLLKWVGANSVRTSHYPYAEEFLDYADRHGLLVIDETPFVGLREHLFTPEKLAQAKTVIGELIARDKNHPSVIMWSLANEPFVESERGAEFFREMYEFARDRDAARPIIYAAHLTPAFNRGLQYYDLICLNQYHGWYTLPGQLDKGVAQFEKTIEEFWQTFQKPILISEFGADALAGVHSTRDQMFSEEYQAEFIAKYYELITSKEYCIGAHVWCFADFRTPQHYTRVVNNRKGVFTRDRQPKLAAHLLRQLWSTSELPY